MNPKDWLHPAALSSLTERGTPMEERIMMGAVDQLQYRGSPRLSDVFVRPWDFHGIVRRTGARIEMRSAGNYPDQAYLVISTAAGPVVVWADPDVPVDEIHVRPEKDAELHYPREKLLLPQLERRRELEIERAEYWMDQAEATKKEIAARGV